MSDDKRRRLFDNTLMSLLVVSVVMFTASTFADAANNRPLRYYTDGGYTAMTYYTNSSGDDNMSLWGINTDNPLCELDVNGTLCINRTGVYFNGVNISGGGGAPTSASYVVMGLDGTLTSERVLSAGLGITLTDTGANGVARINITGLEPCVGTNSSQYNGSEWNCIAPSAGTGTVTSISQGFGIAATPNPITGTGTIAWDNDSLTTICDVDNEYSSWNGTEFVCRSDSSGGSGTVTSVNATVNGTSGAYVTGGPVTTSGTLQINFLNSSASNDGILRSADFSTFNNKGTSNLTLADIVSNIGNWSGNASLYTLQTFSNGIATNLTSVNASVASNTANIATLNSTKGISNITGTGTANAMTYWSGATAIDNATGIGYIASTDSLNITTTGACVYMPGGGRLCGNTTCITLYSPDGGTKVESCD